jgi:hypothetical protein
MANRPMATDSQDLARLRHRFHGRVLLPDHRGYHQARRVWNAMVDRRPAVIARCTGPADVAAAVRFGRALGLEMGCAVELADMPEGERAQPRPHGGGGHHPMAKHRLGGPAAQQLHVVDAVSASDHGVDQGEQLASGTGRAWLVPQVDQLVGGPLDPQPLGQGRRQQQSGAGHRPLVIEGDLDLVQYRMRGWHRKGVLRLGDHDRFAAVILPGQGTFS